MPAVDVLGIEVDTLPQTKLERLKEAIYGVAGSEGVRKVGAPIASWPVTACLSGDPVRTYILAHDDKSGVSCGRTAPLSIDCSGPTWSGGRRSSRSGRAFQY